MNRLYRKWILLLSVVLIVAPMTQLRVSALEIVQTERELLEAIATGNYEEEVQIGGTIRLTAPLIIPDNRKITFRRGTLKWSDNADPRQENMIILGSGSTLTLKNIVIHGNDAVGLINVRSTAKLVLEEGATLRGGYAGTAGGVYNKGKVEIKGGTIAHCAAVNGGGVYNYGEMIMYYGSINDNTATEAGGGIFNIGNLILNGGKVGDNKAETGSGVYQHKDAKRFDVSGYPSVSDGIYLAKNQTVLVSLDTVEKSAHLAIEGVEDEKKERVLVTGIRSEMQDQSVWGFYVVKDYPWKIIRQGSTYVLYPDKDKQESSK